MCGIAGIINFNNNPVSENTLLRVRDTLAHRGPDGAGVYISDDRRIGLVNRRLAILDLSDLGHQPMISEDNNLVITYNGEIYNFRELKRELTSMGYRFKTNTDTEVILNAYLAWGVDVFEKMNGMFAFCIYDKKEDLVYLVRDHAGIKPLYYAISNKQLIFSSEVKAFKVFNNNREENPDWKIYLLIFGHIPEPFTTLKNVFMLPKQSFLKIDVKTGKSEIKKYTEIVFSEKINDLKEAVEQVKSQFIKAIERHLISDAPIGVFLSGGIDSSLIALIAHNFQKDNLRTLSLIFNEKGFSEEKYQNIVLNQIESNHNACLVTEQDFMNSLDDIFQAMDQPTTNGVNTYFIAKSAKESGLKTVLSGLGGDELFGGYPSFQNIDKIWFLRNSPLKSIFFLARYLKDEKTKKFSYLSLPDPLGYYLLFRGLYSIDTAAKLLDTTETEIQHTLEKVYINNQSKSVCIRFHPSASCPESILKRKDTFELGPMNFVSDFESGLYMQNQLLKDTDSMSMKHSVEVRVPFLDKELMRLVYSISEKVKFNGNIPKFLLIKSFEDILPQDIINRKKQGFTFPFQIWMRNNPKTLIGLIPQRKRMTVNRIIKEFDEGKLHWSRIWSLVILSQTKL